MSPDVPVPPARRVRGLLPVPGGDLYYEVTGSGPALVFAHGLGGNHLSWWQQVPYFADRYACVTFAHRGFPPSVNRDGTVGAERFADDLEALVTFLGLEDVCLVAQSMGGWTCLTWALRRSRRVRALVLASTTGPMDLTALGEETSREIDRWGAEAEAAKERLAAEGILASTGGRMALEQPALAFLYRELYDLTPPEYKDRVRKAVRGARNLPPLALEGFGVPTLFVVGEEDLIFPVPAAAAAASRMPSARLVRVAEAGHSVYFERAVRFNREVDAFLAEHGGRPPRQIATRGETLSP